MARVLIVDDERSIRLTLSALLENAGHEVHVAMDAEEALLLLKQIAPDVVVTDIILPKQSGIEFLEAVRAQSPRLPVIVMTGEPSLATASSAVRAKAFDYLSKPISRDTIVRSVAEAAAEKARDDEFERLQRAAEQSRRELERLVEERTRELQERERDLRNAQRLAHVGSWAWEVATGHVVWSEEVYRIFGLDPGEFEPSIDTVMSRLGPDDQAVDKQVMARMRAREEYTFEPRIILRDGSIRRLLSTSQGEYDQDGNLVRVLGTVQDITDRRRAEDALRASEGRYHSLYSAMSEGVCLHEMVYSESGKAVDYRVLDVNPAYETITGLSRDQAVGALASELYGVVVPPFLDIYAAVAETRKPAQFDTYWDPMQKHLSISVFCPNLQQFATVFSDVTESKRLEQEFRSSESKYRLLVENQTDLVVKFGPDLRLRYVSSTCCRAFGRTEDELLGHPFTRLVHEGDRERVRESLRSVRHPPHRTQHEERTFTVDGWRWFEWAARAVLNDEDEVAEIVSVGRDITRRKDAEKALERNRRLLDETQKLAKLGGWEYDVRTRANFWTDQVYAICGVDKGFDVDDLEAVASFFLEDDRETILAAFQKAVDGAEPYDLQLRLRNAQGAVLWVRVTGEPVLEDGAVVRVRGNLVDISDRVLGDRDHD